MYRAANVCLTTTNFKGLTIQNKASKRERQNHLDVNVKTENEMIDATLVIDTLPDTPLLSTSSYGIPLMLFLPLAQTSERQIIHDSRGSCYNNYRHLLVFVTEPNDGIL